MKTSKILNIVYPILLLILGSLAAISILENDWIVALIYALGVILVLLLPHLILPAKKKQIPVRKKVDKKPMKKEVKKEHKSSKLKLIFHKLFKMKEKKVKAGKKKEKKPSKLKHFFSNLFKRKQKHEEKAEEVVQEVKKALPMIKEEKQGKGKRLYKTKKVLKVYQGKEESAPQMVEEKGEKKINLIEINKPEQRKGTSKKSVKTDFDRLIDLVNAKGVISLADAAKALGHEKDQIEAWAKLLEEHGLLQIVYPTFGEIKLKAVKGNG